MTRVKICGLTNRRDAERALELGANALGFVLEPTSPRSVAGDAELLNWVRSVHPFVSTVAVFGETVASDHLGAFTALQSLNRPTAPLGQRLIRAFRPRHAGAIGELSTLCEGAGALLLDAYHPRSYGGSGLRVDWELAADIVTVSPIPVILAGGLTPDNVVEAIHRVGPSAVDVSSGIEERPGIKDHGRLRAFLEAVRSA